MIPVRSGKRPLFRLREELAGARLLRLAARRAEADPFEVRSEDARCPFHRGDALFREEAPNEYKMSLRSKGRLEVLGIAEQFQGGGHMFAAGASIFGNYDEAKNKIVKLLLDRLDSAHGTKPKQR